MTTPSLDKLKNDIKALEEKQIDLREKFTLYRNFALCSFFSALGSFLSSLIAAYFILINTVDFDVLYPFIPVLISIFLVFLFGSLYKQTLSKYREEYAHCESLKNALALSEPPTQA